MARKKSQKQSKFSVPGHGFGRLVSTDARDKEFRMRKTLPIKVVEGRRVWRAYWQGDQGATPHCVGFAWAHWLDAQPFRQNLNPDGIYRMAKFLDEWEGESYEGTSVRAAVKLIQDLGFVQSYHWGWTEEEVISAILSIGPVVIWTDGI